MAPPSGHSLLLISALGIFALDCFTRGQKNSTLIFTKENTIRNCSCSAGIPDCDYSLANLMCSCKTVLPFAVERTSYSGHLTIWFTDTSALGLLLNFTLVRDLKLSLCSTNTLPTEYLAICGLKRLRISTEAKQPSPEQSLVIHNGGESKPREKPTLLHKGWQAFHCNSSLRYGLSVCFKCKILGEFDWPALDQVPILRPVSAT
ncbi:exosomal polycystin-1-interacting protein isoform X2 [Equus asinus]|uniref:exosomal polycystin-1-interacting protein isoform X2 n=1 Tax=Equus asinus TaxID=9793 RepID=UPI0038F6A6BE